MGALISTDNVESKELTMTEELFLEYLITTPSVKEASDHAGVSVKTGYNMATRLKEVIQSRARDQLTLSTLRAVGVLTDSLDADAATEKGELKLKAAEAILDRSGITKHTNVDVQIESTNGLFIIPGKTVVPPEQEPIEGEYVEYGEDGEFTTDNDGDLQPP